MQAPMLKEGRGWLAQRWESRGGAGLGGEPVDEAAAGFHALVGDRAVEDMAVEEPARQSKAGQQVAAVGGAAADQERRQRQQPVGIALAAGAADGAAGLRRDEGEIRRVAGDRAIGEIEAEAE